MYEDWLDGQVYCIAASSAVSKRKTSIFLKPIECIKIEERKKLRGFILVADPDHIKFPIQKEIY